MHIAFVGTFGMEPRSTMSARALPLAQALVRRGHRVDMLLPPWDNPSDAGRCWTDNGVTITNTNLPAHVPLAWYGMLTRDLLQKVDALSPDVIHAFKPKGFSGAVAQAALVRRRDGAGPTVVVDTDDWEGDGGWNDREPYPWWQKRVFNYQEQYLLKHGDAITAASRTLEDMTVDVRGTTAGVYYVPNGSAGPFREPDESAVNALRYQLDLLEGPVVLLYTRFVECPPERMLTLLGKLAATDARPTVLLVGTGLHGEEKTFVAQANMRGLPLRIVPVGWVEYAALPDYLALADTALFPMEDNLLNRSKCPARLVDMLSAGMPVVGEAVGQVAEYIVNGESGLLVPPDDLDGLAAAAADLLGDAPRRTSISAAARARIDSTYRWDILAATLEEAYHR